MGIIIGIDIGGSTTKIIGLGASAPFDALAVQAGDPVTSAYGAFGRFISENDLRLDDIDRVMCTGVGSTFLTENIYGIDTLRVDEFMAIGLGGKYGSGFDNTIVVSMGTGTAIVSVRGDEISHVCGTGVGGGTILGLSKKLFGATSFAHIVELAREGDASKVDLSIGDISRVSLSNMNVSTTASNFGKASDAATSADLAAGVLNMVFQTIGIFAMMAARTQNTRDIVLTGNLSQIGQARDILGALEELYDVRYLIPENSDFATAIGAALYGAKYN